VTLLDIGHATGLALLVRAPEGEGHAGGHESTAFLGLPMGLWQAVNLILFVGLLVYLLRKPLADFFGDRRRSVEEALRKADESRQQAEALSREVEQRLLHLETEVKEIRAQAVREAEREKKALLAQAESDAERVVARASAEIESRVRAARAELTAYAGDLAVDAAAAILKKTVTAEDQRRLLEDGFAAMGKMQAGRAPGR
jgi:F-type H+-transporting ATPase subunit b